MEISEQELAIRRERMLGKGLTLGAVYPGYDLGFDLELASGPNGSDLAMLSGFENLAQALRVAMLTLRGSDVFNVAFGFDGLNALTQPEQANLVRDRIRVSVINVLRTDPRVKRIHDIRLGEDDRATMAESAPQNERAAARNRLTVKVVFETISGEEVAIQLGAGSFGVSL
jgi:phage baseplate assembly protein W